MSKSQIRLQQLTGSVAEVSPVTIAAGAADPTLTDLKGLLDYYAQALSNVHGNTRFGNQTPGVIRHGHVNDVQLNLTGSGNTAKKLRVGIEDFAGNSQIDNVKLEFRTESGAAGERILLRNATGNAEGASSDGAILLDASGQGGIGLVANASKKVYISAGELEARSSVDIVSAKNAADSISIKTTTGSPSDNLAQVLVENVNGTNAEAIKIKGTAGGIKLESAKQLDFVLADGLAKFDLNGTDAADGLLVDAVASVTLQSTDATTPLVIDAKNAANTKNIKFQHNSTDVLVVSSSAVIVEKTTASGGTTSGALVVKGGVGIADDLYIGDQAHLQSVGALLTLGENDILKIGHDKLATGLHSIDTTESLFVTGAIAAGIGGGMLLLSGSGATIFQGSGLTNNDGTKVFGFPGVLEDGLVLCSPADVSTYTTAFGNQKSLLAAINQINSAVSATDPTLLSQVLSASVAAGTPKFITPADIPLGGGTAAKFSAGPMADIAPAKIEVYLNGQQLLSGSEAQRAATPAQCDYHVPAPGQIKFSFALQLDDVLTVRDRT